MDQLWAIRQNVDPSRARVSFVNYNDCALFGAWCTAVANEGCFFCRLNAAGWLGGRQSPVEGALVRRVSRGLTASLCGLVCRFHLVHFQISWLGFRWLHCPISPALPGAQ